MVEKKVPVIKKYSNGMLLFFASVSVVLIVFSSFTNILLFDVKSSLIDELAILVLVGVSVVVAAPSYRNILPYLYLSLMSTILVLVSLLFGAERQVASVVSQVVLHLQYFFIFAAIYIISKIYPKWAAGVLSAVVVLSFLGALFQYLAPDAFNGLLSADSSLYEKVTKKSNRLVGLQLNANAFGIFFSFIFVCTLYMKGAHSKKLWRYALAGIILAMILLSGSRTAILFCLVALLVIRLKIKIKLLLLLFLLAISIVSGQLHHLIQKTLNNYNQVVNLEVKDARYTRWLLLYHGVHLAVEKFPLGAGAATYATPMSKDSSVYREIGLDRHKAVSNWRGDLFDSNFAAIAGEFGFLGIVLFYGLFVWMLVDSWSFAGGTDKRVLSVFLIVGLLAPFMRPFFMSSYYGVVFSLAYMTCLFSSGRLAERS